MFFGFIQGALAESVFKITSANFDTSSAVISLTSSNIEDFPEISNIKVVKLTNPTRVYFDIPGAILAGAKKDWVFTTDGIKEVKVSQFASNPNIVRVVVYYDDNFDISNMNFVTLKNGVFIKLKNDIVKNPFMQNIYRDDRASSNDFYEYRTLSSASNPNETIARIDNAFNNHTTLSYSQELKLNTKYYADKMIPKDSMLTITGMGSAAIEKPMILSNPSRIAFDMPTTLVNKALRNREFSLGGSDTARLGQFSVNKARLVITTPNVTKYIPVYSRDNQSIVFINSDKFSQLAISGKHANISGYLNNKIDDMTSAMTINFDAPVIHGFDRTNSEVIAYLFNVKNMDESAFNKAFQKTDFSSAKIEKTSHGTKIVIPIEHDSLVTSFMGLDGKSLKFQIKAPRTIIKETTEQTPIEIKIPPINMPKGTDGKFKVVIDAGHGGSDVGATRNGVYEKYITIDVAKRVEKMLKAQGYGVLMTRSDDSYVSLQDRVAFSEAYSPDIFVSIHVNSSTSETPNGIETHYYHPESIPRAQTVHASLISSSNAHDRGTFKSKFYVINHTTSPAILVEMGFLSNTAERGQLVTNDRKQATAKAIVEGINNYFKSAQQ